MIQTEKEPETLCEFVEYVRVQNPERIRHDMGRYQMPSDAHKFARMYRLIMMNAFMSDHNDIYLSALCVLGVLGAYSSWIYIIPICVLLYFVVRGAYIYFRGWKYYAVDFIHLVEMLYIVSHIREDVKITNQQVDELIGLVETMTVLDAKGGYSVSSRAGLASAMRGISFMLTHTLMHVMQTTSCEQGKNDERLYNNVLSLLHRWNQLTCDVMS